MSLILRCPVCEKHYEENDEVIKQEVLHCPLCGTDAAVSDFSAMMFCPHCRGKLAVSLDMLNEASLSCPRCNNTFVPTVNISLDDDEDDDMDLFADESEKKSSFNEGDFFDKYKIIRLLGRGGMGEVYLAEHLFLHREVALKIMLSDVAKNSVFAKRFIREAKIANKIESPNLIGVFDVGIESKTEMLFIAMEFVNGRNVSELIEENGVFDEQTTLNIAYNVINALEAMESENVVHRDIKPSNIMIDYEGNIKLADLGIAKSNNHAEGDLTLTQESVVFGTPNYASPEQCRSSHNVDSRSDIYSLGATMYQMVTGVAPYTGSTGMEIMLKVLGDTTPDFDKLRGMSAGFTALLYDMLQKDPDKRPQNIAELRERIENLMNGENILRYKMRVMLKKALPILKNIGINILKAPFVFLKKKTKNDSAVRHFFNFILFCALLYLGGMIAYKHREYLTDLWVKHVEKQGETRKMSLEQQRRLNDAKFRQAQRRFDALSQKTSQRDIVRRTVVVKKNTAPVAQNTAAENPPPAVDRKKKVLDSDEDGIPNHVEVECGLNPYDANDAKLDNDNDGISNIEEYKRGTLRKFVPKKKTPAIDYNALAESSKLAEKEKQQSMRQQTQTSAPQTVKPQKIYPDTIEGRMQRCNDIIAELKEKSAKDPKNPWLREQLKFMENTVSKNLQKQMDNRKIARSIKERGRFDEAANNEIKTIYRNLAERIAYHGVANDRETQAELNKLTHLLYSRNFDPNITVEDPRYKKNSGTLLKNAVIHRFISGKMAKSIINILLRRRIHDTDDVINSPTAFWEYEDILRYGFDTYKNFWRYAIGHSNALSSSRKQHFITLLTELGADVNQKVLEASILHWAVSFCDYNTVKKVLLAGADINAVDNNGQTPLFWAEKYANDSIVKLLTALGSNTDHIDNFGKKAADYKHYGEFNDALKRNNIKEIESLLAKYPELVNSQIFDGGTPLYYAVEKTNVQLVKKLIGFKADVNKYVPFNARRPADISVNSLIRLRNNQYSKRNANFTIYKLLLEAGAQPIVSYPLFNQLSYKKIDNIDLFCMLETVKYIKNEESARWILQIIYRPYYGGRQINNSKARTAVTTALFKSVSFDMSQPEYRYIFSNAASDTSTTENELKLMLQHRADVNSKNQRGMTALFNLCSTSSYYTNHRNYRINPHIPPLNDIVRRIRFLLINKADVNIEYNGRTIADLNLPQEVKNIYQIRLFLRKKGKL